MRHSFGEGTDGANPRAALIADDAGNLYGTTQEGGANQAGTVFKLDKGGNETVLFNLGGNVNGSEAGGFPFASVIRDACRKSLRHHSSAVVITGSEPCSN